MDTRKIETEITAHLQQRVAKGLNAAAQRIVADIQDHVPVRTGALQRSWQILRPAAPDNLETQIGSLLDYSRNHYPYPPLRPAAPGRNRALEGRPLFNQKPTPSEAAIQVVHEEIKRAL